MADIIEALKETNKWWSGKFELDYKRREIYGQLKKFLSERQMLALTGLRRVGKTTLMLRLAKERIEDGFDPKNLVYFSFDDFRDVRITDVLKAYSDLMDRDLDKGSYLLLLDELQKVKGWGEQVKRIYDNHKNFKIIISGSESLFIRKGSRESLAGRFFEFRVGQLTFKEFLDFKGVEIRNLKLQEGDFSSLFKRYLLTNGFPEIIDSRTETIKKYIREGIIEKVIYRDIPQILPVKDPAILESLLNIIMKDPGEMLNMEELAGDLGISRQTVSLYLDYLEKSFLIRKLYNFSKNARKTERKLKKYYPAIISPEMVEKGDWAKVLETASVLGSKAEFFWRDAYKHEVDMILMGDGMTPVEIKSGKIETRSILYFMDRYKISKGFILTKEREDEIRSVGKHIIVKPLWKWLLS
jgi:predicted AAA+ superfamily ATPase